MHIQIWREAIDRCKNGYGDHNQIGEELDVLTNAMEDAWPNSRWLPRLGSVVMHAGKAASVWDGRWHRFNLVLQFDPADPSWTLLVMGDNGWAMKSWQAVAFGNGEAALPEVVKSSRRAVGWWLQSLSDELLDLE